MDIHIGITGTRNGMTLKQIEIFTEKFMVHVLSKQHDDRIVFHHGDCIGADAEAHDVAFDVGCHVVIHPPTNKRFRAFKTGHETREDFPYLIRDQMLVDEINILFATPKSMKEEIRSGTWATVRYARKIKKNLIIIYPDGSLGK